MTSQAPSKHAAPPGGPAPPPRSPMSSGRKMKTAAPRSFSLSGYVLPRSPGRAAHPPLHQRAGRQLRHPPCRNAAGGLTAMREAPNRMTGVHAPENNGTAAATCVEHRHSRPHPRCSAKNVFRPCFAGPDGRRGCGARGQRALRPAEQGGIIVNFATRRALEKPFAGDASASRQSSPSPTQSSPRKTASLMRGVTARGKTCHQGLEGGFAYRPGYWGAALCKVCSCMATTPMWTRAFAKPAPIRTCILVSPARRTRRLQSNSENLLFYQKQEQISGGGNTF